ncbi:hypothetical protein [Microbacterium dextranolyticum]|nr:hypothetical protein [Microbacterium dextranolyticum]MBM7461709.1 putative membrane protein affecting hemolysin expression [Microbacterium dextranolyticum]
MWSTSALRVMAIFGTVISLIGVILAVLLGAGLVTREPASEWLVVATASVITVGVVLTI